MPVINEDTLKKDISSGKFAPVYLVYGDDSYLKRHYRDTLMKKAYDGDPFFNLQRFEGMVDLQDVFDAVNQFPMMAERKCVVISDYDYEQASKDEFDRLCKLISDSNDFCVVVLNFDSVDFDYKRNNKAKKIFHAVEKGNGKCVELNHRSITALAKILSDGAAKRGCKLGEISAKRLIEISGNDLNTLRNELDKLCNFVGTGEIRKEIVDLVSVKSVDASVYDYVKQIFLGDISNALKLLDEMLYMRIEPITILYAISTSYVDMFRISAASKVSVNRAQVSSDFEYKNRAFLLDRAVQNLRKFNNKSLDLSLDALLEADNLLKSFGVDPRIVLEQLTLKLIYIIEKGESVVKT